ncbi:MAG: hypothetical protein SGI74_14745 [Oligoflexia bacterium]|nr:hypothetical protein [Oligoflexia bacterium]
MSFQNAYATNTSSLNDKLAKECAIQLEAMGKKTGTQEEVATANEFVTRLKRRGYCDHCLQQVLQILMQRPGDLPELHAGR